LYFVLQRSEIFYNLSTKATQVKTKCESCQSEIELSSGEINETLMNSQVLLTFNASSSKAKRSHFCILHELMNSPCTLFVSRLLQSSTATTTNSSEASNEQSSLDIRRKQSGTRTKSASGGEISSPKDHDQPIFQKREQVRKVSFGEHRYVSVVVSCWGMWCGMYDPVMTRRS
jgi:hypothetical protein